VTCRWFREEPTGPQQLLGDGPVLTLSEVSGTGAGTYYAVVSNAAGSVTTSKCVVVVDALPRLLPTSTLPASLELTEGDELVLEVTGV
jgi:hypothetical protein